MDSNYGSKLIIGLFFLFSSYSFGLVAKIGCSPGTAVSVGEEVNFDAMGSTYDSSTIYGKFEWDFGDGYSLKEGSNPNLDFDGGTLCSHFYSKAGSYKVKLSVFTKTGNVAYDSVVVKVSGESPIRGFELLHADFHCRIAQPIYFRIPEQYRNNSAVSLQFSLLDTAKNTQVILFKKNSPKALEQYLFKNSEYSKGTYILSAELFNGAQKISCINEYFNKPYDGKPTVGIDENNAIWSNGKPFFPVTPWLLSKSNLPTWSNPAEMNSLYGIGWYNDGPTPANWADYVRTGYAYNYKTIGPTQWNGIGPLHYVRNSDAREMTKFLNITKSEPGLLAWMWQDEVNMGGEDQYVPSAVVRGWTYLSHKLDPQHPVIMNFMGADYLPGGYIDWTWHHLRINKFSYIGDTITTFGDTAEFGGKRVMPVDIIGFDNYPIEYCDDLGLNDPKRGPIDLYIESLDNLINWNMNLVPAFSFIETNDINHSGHPAPTPDQVLMLAWLSVIHGAKGINWFHYFGETPAENLAAMSVFCNQINSLTPIILSPPSTIKITSNANKQGNRVDFMVRDSGDNIFVFAARLTEPTWESQKVNEPESVSVPFKSETTIKDHSIGVLGENRSIAFKSNGFSDVFKRNAVHIYVISKSGQNINISVKNMLNKTGFKTLKPVKKTILFNMNEFKNGNRTVYDIRGRFLRKDNNILNNKLSSGIYVLK